MEDWTTASPEPGSKNHNSAKLKTKTSRGSRSVWDPHKQKVVLKGASQGMYVQLKSFQSLSNAPVPI